MLTHYIWGSKFIFKDERENSNTVYFNKDYDTLPESMIASELK